MRKRTQVLLLTILTIPVMSQPQATDDALTKTPELSVILEPGPVVDGVPIAFTFHLINVGQRDLRLPEPYVDCSNAISNGSVWLNESWQPPAGDGLAKGAGSCDFGVSGKPPRPIVEVATNWHLLKPGESLYIEATQANLHYESDKPGVYAFSAVYLPPSLDPAQMEALNAAGVAVPQHQATSMSLQYEKSPSR